MNALKTAAKTAAKEATKVLKLTVNGHIVHVPQGATLLDAAKAVGARVPTLCFNPNFKAKATCRMCMVNVEGNSKPVASCHTPAKDGMVIHTDTQELKQYRKRDLQFMLSRHPNDCMRCEASGRCKLQDLVLRNQVEEIWPKTLRGSPKHPEHVLHDHSSPAIYRDMDKCILCGLCVQACESQNINAIGFAERGGAEIPVPAFDKPLIDSGCINCGQCTLRCPVGAVIERPDWHRVMDVLDSKTRKTVVQTAPAVRVAIGEEFGFEPGTITTGKLANSLRAAGFDYVMDTNFAADLTIMEEANELLSRVRGERPDAKLPLFTSCCPGWINYVEIYRPDLIPHLSTTKSPQQMHGAVTKYGPFAKTIDSDEEPFVVSIMPCTAKKDEAERPGQYGDIDAVLTTRELAKLLKRRKVNFSSLPDDGQFDSPLGESTGAAAIFAASGGVLEAALRTAAFSLGIEAPLDWTTVRGVEGNVKVATVPGVGSVAAVNSIASATELLSNDSWKDDYLMIEVMTCPGGCLGGGGQPKSDDPLVKEKRMRGIYEIDAQATKRQSHENEEVKQLYDEFLGEPLSETSEQFLHATYAARGSPRNKLMRFLDAVDRRDGSLAASLVSDDMIWHTTNADGEHGTVQGRTNVESFIQKDLPPIPPLRPGMIHLRHKMLDHAHGTDVVKPNGDKLHFDIELDSKTGLIKSLSQAAI